MHIFIFFLFIFFISCRRPPMAQRASKPSNNTERAYSSAGVCCGVHAYVSEYVLDMGSC
jgi:hypothetical protein